MSSKAPVGYIDVRVLAHATEDAEKVVTAVRHIFPLESVDTVSLQMTNLTGHHGNLIILIGARIKDRKAVQTIFARLCTGLNMLDKETLSKEIEKHMERGNLFLRLDKQSAFLNELRLGSMDPIHLQIHFKKHSEGEILDVCRESGLLP